MRDEEYVFVQDVRDKKVAARSASKRRTHRGKGGAVRFPSDFMTRKELKAMNGEVQSYRLNDPMKWAEFKKMPDDIKISYIKLLRQRFECFDSAIAEMMGVSVTTLSLEVKRLGIGYGAKHGGNRKWSKKEEFWAWVNGTQNDVCGEDTPEGAEIALEQAEDDFLNSCSDEAPLPFEILYMRPDAIPCSGSMTFVGSIEAALDTARRLLGDATGHITIAWDVKREEGMGQDG